MIVRIKDSFKLIGIMIIAFCAVFICTLFLNYMLDLSNIGELIEDEAERAMFDAQMATSKIVCLVCGGCLLLTSSVMLVFYIRHYVDIHKKELGILKAFGYSNFFISRKFGIFGISVALGTSGGFLGACILMPAFYKVQSSSDNVSITLPEVSLSYHFSLFLCIVVIPSVIFSLLSVIYAAFQLKKSPIFLLKSNRTQTYAKCKVKDKSPDTIFLNDMKKNTLRSKKILVFFCVFSSLCFASTTQMSFSMEEYASPMMSIIMMFIGIILSFTTLFIALHTVIEGNMKGISMMRVFGYTESECRNAITNGYRPWVYIGFIAGSLYQYILMKIMINIVFAEMSDEIPPYKFDFGAMFISLIAFILFYELSIYLLSRRIGKIHLSEIMSEE